MAKTADNHSILMEKKRKYRYISPHKKHTQADCMCPCHSGAKIVHFLPCCEPCPLCNMLVARGMQHIHQTCCSGCSKTDKSNKGSQKNR